MRVERALQILVVSKAKSLVPAHSLIAYHRQFEYSDALAFLEEWNHGGDFPIGILSLVV